MEFHVSRLSRDRYQFDLSLFSPEAPFFHDGRVSIYRDLGWCWFWTKEEEATHPEDVPSACIGHTRPILGTPRRPHHLVQLHDDGMGISISSLKSIFRYGRLYHEDNPFIPVHH